MIGIRFTGVPADRETQDPQSMPVTLDLIDRASQGSYGAGLSEACQRPDSSLRGSITLEKLSQLLVLFVLLVRSDN